MFQFPDVQVNDIVLYSAGAVATNWSPLLVTAVLTKTVRQESGESIEEPYAVAGVAITKERAAVTMAPVNVVYPEDSPLLHDNPVIFNQVARDKFQGIFKIGERLQRLMAWEARMQAMAEKLECALA